MFEQMIKEMSLLEDVYAIALGGSRAKKNIDRQSDYDVYVYYKQEIPVSVRQSIIDKYTRYMEYNNTFWETEDDGVLNDGTVIEFIYRDLDFIPEVLDNLFINKVAGNGYSTCFYDNLMSSIILFERTGYLTNLKNRYQDSYTTEIKDLIINKNLPLLKDSIPALYSQIIKALERHDYLSVNHRLTEFYAIYFDILFAINQYPHPGEKRMLYYAENLDKKPKDLALLVNKTLQYSLLKDNELSAILDTLIAELINLI